MTLRLEKATHRDAEDLFTMQVKAFTPLLEKYKDDETNPANETLEKVLIRINNPKGGFYKLLLKGQLIGAISLFWKEKGAYWISPMFISAEYQGMGLAQQAITLIEEHFSDACSFELATIKEEKRNVYFYEKMGYVQTGVSKRLNDQATLIFYKKLRE